MVRENFSKFSTQIKNIYNFHKKFCSKSFRFRQLVRLRNMFCFLNFRSTKIFVNTKNLSKQLELILSFAIQIPQYQAIFGPSSIPQDISGHFLANTSCTRWRFSIDLDLDKSGNYRGVFPNTARYLRVLIPSWFTLEK